ncbi:probable inorganic phosphate transporter 1-9 [Tanacetum coccineum]
MVLKNSDEMVIGRDSNENGNSSTVMEEILKRSVGQMVAHMDLLMMPRYIAIPKVEEQNSKASSHYLLRESEQNGIVHVRGETSTGGKIVTRHSRVFEMKFQQQSPPNRFTSLHQSSRTESCYEWSSGELIQVMAFMVHLFDNCRCFCHLSCTPLYLSPYSVFLVVLSFRKSPGLRSCGVVWLHLTLSILESMVFVSLGFFRFVLGIGIGGDYPLSATIMSEFANKRTPCAHGLKSPKDLLISENIAPVPPEADVAWRLILMIGAIPASMTCYWRLKMPETARNPLAFFAYYVQITALVEKNTLQAAKDMEKVMNVSLSTIREDVEMMDTPNTRAAFSNMYPFFSREFFRRHGRDLAAASINCDMNIYDDAWQVAKFQALVAAAATIPGYFVTVYMIDYVGRVKIQAAGFFFMAVSLFTIAKVNKGGWGSNPGAFGKMGAIVGTVGFLWVSRDSPSGQEVSDVLMVMGGVRVWGCSSAYLLLLDRQMAGSLEENENVDEFTGVCFIRFWPNKVWAKRTQTNTCE